MPSTSALKQEYIFENLSWSPDLVERVDERLETGEVPDELEDPHNAHDADQPHDLAGLPHDLKILQEAKYAVSFIYIDANEKLRQGFE